MKTDGIGLYLHIPFCLRKCNYCDFCSFPESDESTKDRYVSSLIREILSYKREARLKVNTVFFGGGTPSLLSTSQFEKISDAISEAFIISEDIEFTVESNPKTLTPEKLLSYKACGVNRISIGMQSIHEKELKKLGRRHSFDDFLEAYQMVSDVGIDNINVDLMYGIPHQTIESLEKTIENVISLSPSHISAYGLIIEEGTPFYDCLDSLALPSEDSECDMYELICKKLRGAGYGHYEISNYSKPGYECRHNLTYWKNKEYIGVGISAHSYFEGKRYFNGESLDIYLCNSLNTRCVIEEVNQADFAFEYAMLRLRLSEGLDLSEFERGCGFDFLLGNEEKIAKYQALGLLVIKDGRLFFTEKGFYLSNTLLSDLL